MLPHSKYDLSYQSPITSIASSNSPSAAGSSQNDLESRLGDHYVKTEPSGNKSDSSDSSRDDIVPLKNDVKMNRLLFSPLKNGGKSHMLDIEHYSPLQHAPTDVQLATVDNGELAFLCFGLFFFSAVLVCEKLMSTYTINSNRAYLDLYDVCNTAHEFVFFLLKTKPEVVYQVLSDCHKIRRAASQKRT